MNECRRCDIRIMQETSDYRDFIRCCILTKLVAKFDPNMALSP
jgi:hypothetical protein